MIVCHNTIMMICRYVCDGWCADVLISWWWCLVAWYDKRRGRLNVSCFLLGSDSDSDSLTLTPHSDSGSGTGSVSAAILLCVLGSVLCFVGVVLCFVDLQSTPLNPSNLQSDRPALICFHREASMGGGTFNNDVPTHKEHTWNIRDTTLHDTTTTHNNNTNTNTQHITPTNWKLKTENWKHQPHHMIRNTCNLHIHTRRGTSARGICLAKMSILIAHTSHAYAHAYVMLMWASCSLMLMLSCSCWCWSVCANCCVCVVLWCVMWCDVMWCGLVCCVVHVSRLLWGVQCPSAVHQALLVWHSSIQVSHHVTACHCMSLHAMSCPDEWCAPVVVICVGFWIDSIRCSFRLLSPAALRHCFLSLMFVSACRF